MCGVRCAILRVYGARPTLFTSWYQSVRIDSKNKTKKSVVCTRSRSRRIFLENMEKYTSAVRSTRKVFNQNSVLQAVCGTVLYFDRACCGVFVPS